MGLDMYLDKRTFIIPLSHGRANTTEINFITNPCSIQPKRINKIIERVAYWRKFNSLHEWFVQNIQNGKDDCESYLVTTDQLKNLLDTLQSIKKSKVQANNVLPPKEGFFFGSTNIDEDYFENVAETILTIKSILEEPKDDMSSFYYGSSW